MRNTGLAVVSLSAAGLFRAFDMFNMHYIVCRFPPDLIDHRSLLL